MKRHVRKGQRLCIALAVPVGLLAGTGDLIINALYPREFLAAGPVLMFKVFFDLFGMLALLKRPALTAMGMPKWNTFASVLRLVLSAALAPVASAPAHALASPLIGAAVADFYGDGAPLLAVLLERPSAPTAHGALLDGELRVGDEPALRAPAAQVTAVEEEEEEQTFSMRT